MASGLYCFICHFVSAFLGVDVELDGLAQIEREDSHDGLGIDHVAAGYQVKIIVKTGNIINERLDFIDRV